ncbi:hypothetical protein DET49_10381 [Salegentibacter sp. 24]|nr:hypothetical protein DET49_10381 [Salegentibacter sp. 24]
MQNNTKNCNSDHSIASKRNNLQNKHNLMQVVEQAAYLHSMIVRGRANFVLISNPILVTHTIEKLLKQRVFM